MQCNHPASLALRHVSRKDPTDHFHRNSGVEDDHGTCPELCLQ